MEGPTTQAQLIVLWETRAFVAQKSHYESAVKLDRRNYLTGILGVVFSAVVGSAVFATLTTQGNVVWLKIGAGVISLFAAVLAGIQTFRHDGERAAKHRSVAAKFSILQRDLELLATRQVTNDELQFLLSEFNEKYKQLISEAPVADGRIFEKFYNAYLGESTTSVKSQKQS